MATQLHPADVPKVFGVATNGQGIRDLQALEVSLLKDGQITGLNGVPLAAAADRELPALCLLGELPYFAAGVPNPKASKAVLEVFTSMARIELDMSELKQQAAAVEKALLQLLEKLEEASRDQSDTSDDSIDAEGAEDETVGEIAEPEKAHASTLDPADRRRIEAMFTQAIADHAKAFALKQELDRLGVFKQYEDRFLDLFRKGQ
jgi:hypothetical protein